MSSWAEKMFEREYAWQETWYGSCRKLRTGSWIGKSSSYSSASFPGRCVQFIADSKEGLDRLYDEEAKKLDMLLEASYRGTL